MNDSLQSSAPVPVHQVHNPKLLGEVLLLNCSQLLEFFFPLSLLIGESPVFSPELICKRKKKKEQEIIAQEERSFEEVFVIPPYILHFSFPCSDSSQMLFVPQTRVFGEV